MTAPAGSTGCSDTDADSCVSRCVRTCVATGGPMSGEVGDRFDLAALAVPLPVLIGCSHGTADPAGRAAVRDLLEQVAEAAVELGWHGLEIREAFVDVQQPQVGEVVAGAVQADGRGAVVLPLLLSGGFHVHVDIAAAVVAAGGRAVAARPLGPDPRIVQILGERLAESFVEADVPVVIAAAGSSDPRAGRDVAAVTEAIRELRPGPVTTGFGAMARPTVREAVTAAGPRAVALSYLLALGHFQQRVQASGARVVTRPLAPHPLLAEIVLDRYAAAVLRRHRIGATGPAVARP